MYKHGTSLCRDALHLNFVSPFSSILFNIPFCNGNNAGFHSLNSQQVYLTATNADESDLPIFPFERNSKEIPEDIRATTMAMTLGNLKLGCPFTYLQFRTFIKDCSSILCFKIEIV
jgi:hypothetical protein